MNDRRMHIPNCRTVAMATVTAALLSGWQASPSRAAPSSGMIHWRSAAATESAKQTVNQLAEALRALVPDEGARHIVVVLDQSVNAETRHGLNESGVKLLAPLGRGAFFASVSADRLDVARASAVATLHSVSTIEPAHKLHHMLANGNAPTHSVVGRVKADQDSPADLVAVYCLLHRDVALNDGIAAAAGHKSAIMSVLTAVNGLVLELPRGSIEALANEDSVQWIEPALPPLDINNAEIRILTQVNALQAPPYGLNGSGVNVLVYDAGSARASHLDFSGRLFRRDASPLHYHSTHVAGTIGGDGTASGGMQRGMAPGVTIQSFGFQSDGSPDFLYADPGDLQGDYAAAINALGVDIANNSIGTNVEANGYDCAWQGNYGITEALIDSIIDGSLGQPFRIVWAAGNERNGSNCDVEGYGDYYSISPPSGAKNSIVVGAVNANDDSMTWFSSWGPTDDGRLKPDICAPGCQVDGDNGVTSTGVVNDAAYLTTCGTSMAAPTVTGICALILEDFRNQFSGQSDPLNSTLKILLVHNAVDRGDVGPDYQFGYGSVRAKETIDFMRTGNIAESSFSQSGIVRYWVPVNPGTPSLKITLAWDDVPGTPNVNPALINDLDLVVFDPSSGQHYPWTLNPFNPGAPAVQTHADHTNNIEQVVAESPSPGVWTVEVRGFAVPEGPQSFSICASPRLVSTPLVITFPNGTPQYIHPATETTFDVKIESISETYVSSTGLLYYREDGGTYQTTALTPLSADLYQATLPAIHCSGQPEFYVSAQGSGGSTVSNPTNAPTSVHTAFLGQIVTLFADDFESDQGWTVRGNVIDPTTGMWQRGTPANGNRGDPATDFDGSGQCYLTGNMVGNSDVDGGSTILTSPSIDLSAGGILSYRYWFNDISSGAMGPEDSMTVQIANDLAGTNWQTLRTYTTAAATWRNDSINIGLEIAATPTVRIRFTATDNTPGDVIEAGMDAIRATSLVCDNTGLHGDLDGDGAVDTDDVPFFTEALLDEAVPPGVEELSLADMNGDAAIDGGDIQPFVEAILN